MGRMSRADDAGESLRWMLSPDCAGLLLGWVMR